MFVEKYISKLNSIEQNLEKVAVGIVRDNVDFILYLLKVKQLGENIKSDGSWIGFYKRSTEDYALDPHNKPRTSKVAGQPYSMEWTGQFMDNMVVKSAQDSFSVFSRDGKSALLEKEYGQLLKLTKEHNDTINNEVIKPQLYKYVLENMFRV